MIPYHFSTILWTILISLDIVLAAKLSLLYRKDRDSRKPMFTIGLLMCIPIYFSAIVGISSSVFVANLFGWSAFPILLAFLFTLLNYRFGFDPKKGLKLFLVGTAATIVLFFFSPSNASLLFMSGSAMFLIILGVVQYSKSFELSGFILFLAVPSFIVCYLGIEFGLTELALFSGFVAKGILFVAFEAAKIHSGSTSSVLAIQKELNVAKDNFLKLFNLLPDPAVIVDGKGTFLAITSSVPKLTGFTEEELIGTNFITTQLVTAHSKALLIKNLAKRMLGFHIAPYEVELRSKDGRPLQFELNAAKIEFDGNPADMVIFRDLNERNQLIEFSNMLFEFAPDAYYISDLKGHLLDGNKAAEKLIGYEKKELIGKNFLDLKLLQNRELPKAAKLLALNRLGKRTGPDEFILKRRDGSSIPVEISTYPLKTKDKAVALGIARDISQRKKYEEELESSRNYLDKLLNSMLSGVVVIDCELHQIVYANEVALKLIGLDRKDVLGKVCYDLICPAPKGSCPVTDLNLSIEGAEKGLRCGNGRIIPVLKSVVKTSFGNKTILIENFFDISERKEMQEKIMRSEKLAAVGSLATMIAHDLRNPLQSIVASAFYVKRINAQIGNEKLDATAKHIDDSVRYADKIVNDLLEFSADLNLKFVDSDIKVLIEQALAEVKVPTGIELKTRISENDKVQLEPDKIRRVINCLIKNALDVMPDGGTLTITSEARGCNLVLSIADTGLGIPDQKIEKLWTPFVTTRAKGMGMGLPICKRIVEAHGGTISVETKKGKGTTFTIIIPLVQLKQETINFLVEQPNKVESKT
jgi:PAS domain S-box-containing protein